MAKESRLVYRLVSAFNSPSLNQYITQDTVGLWSEKASEDEVAGKLATGQVILALALPEAAAPALVRGVAIAGASMIDGEAVNLHDPAVQQALIESGELQPSALNPELAAIAQEEVDESTPTTGRRRRTRTQGGT